MNLEHIIHRTVPAVPWAEGENIPWNEPDFSERMLAEHLNQDPAEGVAQNRNGNEEVWAFDGDDATVGIHARSGDDAVQVGMEAEALVPCVQEEGEAVFDRAEPARSSEGAGEGFGGGVEDEVVDGFGGSFLSMRLA